MMYCLICNSAHRKFERMKQHIEKNHSFGVLVECVAGSYSFHKCDCPNGLIQEGKELEK